MNHHALNKMNVSYGVASNLGEIILKFSIAQTGSTARTRTKYRFFSAAYPRIYVLPHARSTVPAVRLPGVVACCMQAGAMWRTPRSRHCPAQQVI